MPFGLKPSCVSCQATSSAIWRKDALGDIVCHGCASNNGNGGKDGGSENGDDYSGKGSGHGRSQHGSHFIGSIRKSARLKPSKYRSQLTTRTIATKGKNRRVIFKKNIIKAPSTVATVVTSDYVFDEGQYFQLGDVVSLMDYDEGIYYAQIRGFLQDQYMEKSAVITWLLPTTSSPPEGFDPASFVLGPEEDIPRRLDCMEYVCHAPTEYFKAHSAPYATPTPGPELGYIWTSLGPEILPVPSYNQIFGLNKPSHEGKSRKEHKERAEYKEKKEKESKEKKEKESKEKKDKETKEKEKTVPKEIKKESKSSHEKNGKKR